MAVITRKHAICKMQDATGTPLVANVSPGEGDFNVSGMESGNVEGIGIYDRGTFLELVDGDQKQYTGQISIYHDGDLTDATNKEVIDAIMKSGAFSAGVSTDTTGTVTWVTDVAYVATRSAIVHTITFAKCRCSWSYQEAANGNKIVVNFTCYGGVTYTSA